jgi:hypothetical protein
VALKLTLGQVADWIHAEGEFQSGKEVLGYSIDSRTISAGELFFAVQGDRLDGHDYVEAALANGAAAAVVSMRWLSPAGPRRYRSVDQSATTGERGSPLLGRTCHRGDWLRWKDDDQGGYRTGAGCSLSGAEIAGEPQQWVRASSATPPVGTRARGRCD